MEYTDNKQLIKEFKKLCLDKDISLTYVASEMGMTRQTLNALLNKKGFSFIDMQRLLDVIDCKLEINIADKE